MVVIFIFSAQNGDESFDTSGFLLELLCDIFRLDPSPEDASMMSFLIRKAALLSEKRLT